MKSPFRLRTLTKRGHAAIRCSKGTTEAARLRVRPMQRSFPMANMKAKYLGDLRVECTHLASGTTIVTDAPVDNQGKGEAFSPTDLCATALASCAMTIIGIYAKQHDVDVTGTEISITKVMSANPRRIGKIEIVLDMPDRDYTDRQKAAIEHCADTCPVHLSLHPDVEQEFVFRWKR